MLVTHLRAGLPEPVPQQGEPTYAAKIEPDELRLDWSQPAVQLHRVVRLGRAWTTFRGRRLGVLAARVVESGPAPGALEDLVVGAGDGAGLSLVEVRPEGRAAMAADAWARGARPEPGERLGG